MKGLFGNSACDSGKKEPQYMISVGFATIEQSWPSKGNHRDRSKEWGLKRSQKDFGGNNAIK